MEDGLHYTCGSFEPVVMFFGITNSPATFQAIMNEILRDMINEGKVVAFVDDILVRTKTKEEHDEIVEEVLMSRSCLSRDHCHDPSHTFTPKYTTINLVTWNYLRTCIVPATLRDYK